MKTGTKTAVSLLITVAVFVGITVASSLGVFSKVENSLYEPAKVNVIQKQLNDTAACSNEYITKLLSYFGPEKGGDGYLSNDEVMTLLNREPSEGAVRAYEILSANVDSLEGIRVVDQNGKRVHYSTFKGDSRREGANRIYSNYSALKTLSNGDELDYSIVSAFAENKENAAEPRIIFDGEEQRVIVSYPVYYNNAGYSFLFYLNTFGLTNRLVDSHLISLGEKVTLVSSLDGKTGGLVFGMPKTGQKILAQEVLKRWENGSVQPEEIVVSENSVQTSGITVGKNSEEEMKAPEEVVSWNMISAQNGGLLHVSGVYPLEMLVMPVYVRILLLICAFISVCLIILIVFSLKKDDDVVIRNRLKKVQLSLLNDYFEKDYSKKKVAGLIESQKDSLSEKVKKSLGRRGRKYGKQLDFMLNQSWEDIIAVLRGTEGNASGLSGDDMAEIRKMFEEIVSSGKLKVQVEKNEVKAPSARPVPESDKKPASPVSAKKDEPEDLEEVEALDEVEDLEDAEPVEEAEPVENLEEAEEVEAVDDAEPVENLEEVEEVEAVDDAEPVEDLEEVEEVEAVDDAEPVEDLEEVEEVEAVDDAEPVEDLEEVEEVEAVDDAESVEDLEEVEEVEAVDDAEPVEDLEEVEDLAPAEGEEIEELENSEENEEIKSLENDEEVSVHFEGVSGFEGTEPLVIGGRIQQCTPEDENSTVADDFFISQPGDFMFSEEFLRDPTVEGKLNLSKLYQSKSETEEKEAEVIPEAEKAEEVQQAEESRSESSAEKASENEKAPENDDDIEVLEPDNETADLEPVPQEGFMFTSFAAGDNTVTELCPEAIVLGDDGVFHITDNLAPSTMPVDEEFKKLVDSVLR